VLLHVRPARLAESPEATLFIRGSGSFVTSATAPIAPGGANQFPGGNFTRNGPAPYTAHQQALTRFAKGVPVREAETLPPPLGGLAAGEIQFPAPGDERAGWQRTSEKSAFP
jgi:hypothetical protein